MLVDANLLIYAVDERSPHYGASHRWLTAALNGEQRVGIPWLSLCAFVRIVTNPRASERPLPPSDASSSRIGSIPNSPGSQARPTVTPRSWGG